MPADTPTDLIDRVREVTYGGLTCWTDGLRFLPPASRFGGANNEIAFLSLVGPQASVRAAWARVKSFDGTKKSKRGATSSGLRVAQMREQPERPSRGWLYDCRSPLVGGPSPDWLHVVLYHSSAVGFSSQVNGTGKNPDGTLLPDWLVMGDNLPVRLTRGLSSRMPLPVAVDWSWLLWERALKFERRAPRGWQTLVTECPGFGLPVYSVSPVLDDWKALIKTLAEEGALF